MPATPHDWAPGPTLEQRLDEARDRLRAGYSLQHAATIAGLARDELDLLLWRKLGSGE